MIQDSMRSGRYPTETEAQKKLAGLVQVSSKGSDDSLDSQGIAIEVRVQDLYVATNYAPNIRHLPGVIEADALDSFRMLCRKLERVESGGSSNVQIKRRHRQ